MLRKTFTTLLLCLACALGTYAQNLTLQGTLVDTTQGMFLENTSVILINNADSILRANTRADFEGKFSLNVPEPGEYMILINHPEFATYIETIKINESKDLGEVFLVTKRNLLEEVVISSRRA